MSVIDQIAQALATAQVARPGRRQVLTGVAVAVTAAVTLRTPDSEAKKIRHRKKKRKRDKGGGPGQGQGCGNGCVSSTCGQTPTECPILPADNIWNRSVDGLPPSSRHAAYVASIGAGVGLLTDFGSGLYECGIQFVRVPAGQAKVGGRPRRQSWISSRIRSGPPAGHLWMLRDYLSCLAWSRYPEGQR